MNFDVGDAASDADEPTDEQDGDGVDENATESEQSESEPETETSSTGESEPTGRQSSREPALTGEPEGPAEPEGPEKSKIDPTETGPAFPYSEVKQSPLYAREETWQEFELWIDTELVPKLRREGIMDDELREIHDIVLEIALDNPNEFVARLKEQRRQS